jgi:hypothetical protein
MSIEFLNTIKLNNEDEKETPLNDLLSILGTEECIGIVLSGFENETYIPKELQNKLCSLDEVKKYLDYEYDSGYGCADLPAIYAWTPTRIIVVCEYDGSTQFKSIPRNPISVEPNFM